MRLLVTRPEPDAGAQVLELRNLGHDPVLQPLLEFDATDFDPACLNGADGLIVTSRNALRALSSKLDLKAVARCPVYCVGGETEQLLLNAGLSVAAIAETAEDLAARIAAQVPAGARLVHATGEHQAFDLAGALAQSGISVSSLQVYTMRARIAFDEGVIAEFSSGAIGGVILMSPRTAEIFVSLCAKHGISDRAGAADYFCLAKSVSNRLKVLGPTRVHVASKPDRAALLALLPHPSTPGQDFV